MDVKNRRQPKTKADAKNVRHLLKIFKKAGINYVFRNTGLKR